jgi:hypothetical protein
MIRVTRNECFDRKVEVLRITIFASERAFPSHVFKSMTGEGLRAFRLPFPDCLAERGAGRETKKRVTWQKHRSDHDDDLGDERTSANLRIESCGRFADTYEPRRGSRSGPPPRRRRPDLDPIVTNRLTQGSHQTPCSWRGHQRLNELFISPFIVQRKGSLSSPPSARSTRRKIPHSDEQKKSRRADRLDETRARLCPPFSATGV